MIPVNQSKLHLPDSIHNGNCFTACLASLLEVPLWMVPPFEEMYGRGDHELRLFQWLEKMFGMDIEYVDKHPVELLPEFYIASGKSERGLQHSVIYGKGELIHDPHYSATGIMEVEYCRYLIKMKGK